LTKIVIETYYLVNVILIIINALLIQYWRVITLKNVDSEPTGRRGFLPGSRALNEESQDDPPHFKGGGSKAGNIETAHSKPQLWRTNQRVQTLIKHLYTIFRKLEQHSVR